jgi:hypothetical protein
MSKKADNQQINKYLDMMHNGTNMFKCTTWGFPHFRKFCLSYDNLSIDWISKNKEIDKTTINIKDINAVLLGQHSSKFNSVPMKHYDDQSFSIVYFDCKKNVDVICPTKYEFIAWTEGLKFLIEKQR